MKPTLSILLLGFLLFSCDDSTNTNQSTTQEPATNSPFKVTEEGLTSKEVHLSDAEGNKIERLSVVYGERVYLSFKNMEGWQKDAQGAIEPGFGIEIIDKSGKKILSEADIASGTSIVPDPIEMNAGFVLAGQDFRVGETYTLASNLWDKKTNKKCAASVEVQLVANDKIKIENKGLEFNTAYLISVVTGMTMVDNKMKFDEDVNLIFDKLGGFELEKGLAFPGVSLKVVDATNEVILNFADLLKGTKGIKPEELTSQTAPLFSMSAGKGIKSPLAVEVKLWDKKSEKFILVTTSIDID